NTAAAGAAHHDRNSGSPAVPALRGEIRDLIESAGDEIRELHFRDRTHSHERGANRGSHDSGFRYRRIDNAPFAEAFEHSGRDFERAAVDADILAENEHTFVLFHLFPDA